MAFKRDIRLGRTVQEIHHAHSPGRGPRGAVRAPADDPGEPGVLLSPLSYLWRHRVEIEAVAQLAAAAAALVTPEEIEADSDALAVLSAGWRLVGLNGNTLDEECTRDNAA